MFRDLPRYVETRQNDFWGIEVPATWGEVPGFAVLSENKVKNDGLVEKKVLSLSYGKLVVKPVEKQRGLVPESYEGYQILEPGDIVIRPTDLQNDQTSIRVGQVRERGIITSAYLGLKPRGGWGYDYAFQYLKVIDSSKQIYGMGNGLRQQLGWRDVKRMPCLVPPAEEQAAIVKYLSHANARIDKAIAAKRRLISLLEEQTKCIARQILSGRILRGEALDSGKRVPWLGKVPLSWNALPIKRLARLRGGTGFPVDRQGRRGNELPFFRVSDMTVAGNGIFLNECDSTVSREEAAELGAVVFEPETVCFPKVGGALLTNKRRLLRTASCLDNNMMGASFFGLDVEFAFEVMKTVDLAEFVKPGPVPAIGQGDVGMIVLPVPSRQVQRDLVIELREAQGESQETLELVTSEIALLQEFRTRLVADVVTGQVDVRAVAATLPDATTPVTSSADVTTELDDLVERSDGVTPEDS